MTVRMEARSPMDNVYEVYTVKSQLQVAGNEIRGESIHDYH